MSSVNDSRIPGTRLVLASIGVILLSVALPVGIVYGAFQWAFSFRPIGLGLTRDEFSAGSVRNGELWYSSIRYLREMDNPPFEFRIMRLDLTTGVARDTGLKVDNDPVYLRWMNDALYLLNDTAIYRMERTGIKKLVNSPANSADFHVQPFLYDEHVTSVVENDNGETRLFHLVDGRWTSGRRIRLPGRNSRWLEDPQRDKKPVLTTTFETEPSKSLVYLRVVQYGQDTHVRLIVWDASRTERFVAYRQGFEFVDDDDRDNPASLTATSASRENPGWEPMKSVPWQPMIVDSQGVLLGVYGPNGQKFTVRRLANGSWETIVGPDIYEFEKDRYSMVSDLSGTAYVVHTVDDQWNTASFYRIDGDTIHRMPATLKGDEQKLVDRWIRLFVGLLVAWLAHVGVLFGALLMGCRSKIIYEFGLLQVPLASATSRGLAFLIDATFFLSILAASWYFQSQYLVIQWERNADAKLSHFFLNLEPNLSFRSIPYLSAEIFNTGNWIGRPRDVPRFFKSIILLFLDTALPLWFCMAYFEGHTGATLGKWLVRIRTVKSTLRPCGVSRSLVRGLLYCVDIPFFLTPLPAVISMILSRRRQRLGDRVADTIVISHQL